MIRQRKTGREKKAFDYYDAYTLHHVSVTQEEKDTIPVENPLQQTARKTELLTDFNKFCRYYFGKYMLAEFGWFHKVAYEYILANENSTTVLEFPRGHAKSVLADILIPLFLKAKGG